jgi:phage tail sheath protein FI
MPAAYTYPGVYIQELPSSVHTIAGVATSIAAFVGYTAHGIDNRAQSINSLGDFTRLYGPVTSDSELSYAVQQFYQSVSPSQAYVVRVPRTGATKASVTFDDATFAALSSGAWANGQLFVDADVGAPVDLSADPKAFNLTVTNLSGTVEYFSNVTFDSSSRNYVTSVVNDPDNGSQLVSVSIPATATPSAVNVTGVVGTAITFANLNTAIGGGATSTTVDANNYALVLGTTKPASVPGLPVTVQVFGKGTQIPQTVAGLAAQLQQAINAVLSVQVRGASVQCTVSPVSGGNGIRINAQLPQQPDAVLSFAAPATGSAYHDAATPLGLVAPATSNVAHYALGTGNAYESQTASAAGTDGSGLPGTGDLIGDPGSFTGIYALQKVDLFNLLCIPDATRALPTDQNALDSTVDPTAIYAAAIALCDQRRAFLLVDPPPNVTTIAGAIDWKSNTLGTTDPNGAAFFPRVRLPDQNNKGNLRTFAPSGVVAGTYAANDGGMGAQSGQHVWTAPAGISATLAGVQSLTYLMSDAENGLLNPLGVNCLRAFPVYGKVLWGARTLAGADALASQWKYVPVRRMALFLEESLYRGTKWAVFQPNDERLWAALRLNIGSFMQNYFLMGAFQGQTPDQAYLVKCDSETTTQDDINNGIVNILVGFAPLQPAEFVVIQIQQLTGQTAA